MTTINDRVKEIRKELGLSGEKFGQPLGVNRSAVSRWESGENKLTEQMIKLISITYNINENWLRTGQGNMFNQTNTDLLSGIKKQFNLTDFQVKLVKSYLELPDTDKKSIDKFISSCTKHTNDNEI